MKSFFNRLSSRFPFFANRPSALERAVRPSPKSRRLRMEPLENRALLAVDAFCGAASLADFDVDATTWGPDPAPAALSASVLATDAAIVDDDTFSLDSVIFDYHLNLCPDPTATDKTPDSWIGPHWVKNQQSATLPVAYASNDTITCEGSMSGEIDPTCGYQIRAVWEYDNKTYESGWGTYSNGNANVEFDKNFQVIFGGRQAYYDPNFTLTWQFKVVGEDTAREIGNSVNPLYVTYDAPSTGADLYHTVVHTACAAANGIKTEVESEIFDAIWEKFESLSIPKINLINGVVTEGETLSYYGKPASPENYAEVQAKLAVVESGNTYSVQQFPSKAREMTLDDTSPWASSSAFLLAFLDGTCKHWQNFAFDALRSQGITTTLVNFSRVSPANASSLYTFAVSPTLLGQGGAQGGAPRENIWSGHSLIMYDNKIYDPSYGQEYGLSNEALQNFIDYAVVSVGSKEDIEKPSEYAGYGVLYKPKKLTADIQVGVDMYWGNDF